MRSNLNEAAGRILKKHRLKTGTTQMGLAPHIGVSYQQVQKYEKGASTLSIARLRDYAIAFGMKPTLLLKHILDEART